jgi:hypothetical protein
MMAAARRDTALFVALWTVAQVAIALAMPTTIWTSWPAATVATLLLAGTQWLLLRDHVLWATRWAVATVVASLVCRVALSSGPLLRVGMAASSLPPGVATALLAAGITAACQAAVLWSTFRRRTLILVALAPVAAIIGHAVGRLVVGWQPVDSSLNAWLGQAGVVVAVVALVEAGSLLWLSHGEVARPVDVQRGTPGPATSTDPPRLITLVPVWVLGAGVIVAALLALRPAGTGRTPSPILAIMLGPYLVALLCTAFRPTRPFALATLAGAAGVIVVVGAPAATMLAPLVLVGAAGEPSRLAGALALLAVTPLNGLLLVAASLAFWRTTLPAVRPSAAVVGVSIAIVAVPMAGRSAVTLDLRQKEQRAAQAQASPEARFERAIDALRRCLPRESASENAWPRVAGDLTRPELGCFTAETLQPADRAYAVHVAAPPGDGPSRAFTACVSRPDARFGFVARLVDERPSGGLYASGEGATPLLACAKASGDAIRHVRHCLWAWAAEHDGTYPDSLDALGERGPGQCLARGWELDLQYYARVTYIPRTAGRDGRATSFVLIESPLKADKPGRSRRLDETGVVRATNEVRLPTAHDPTDEAARAQQLTQRDLDQSGVATWERQCSPERPPDCRRLANVLERRAERWRTTIVQRGQDSNPITPTSVDDQPLAAADLSRAAGLYRTACMEGVAEACDDGRRLLMLQPGSSARDAEIGSLSTHGCALGSTASCEASIAQGGVAADGAGRARGQSLQDACAAGARLACRAAGERAFAPAEARRMFERACDLGDPDGCMKASRLYATGSGWTSDPERMRVLRSLACSATVRPDGCGNQD